jgi:hypothetical protein
MANPIIKVKRSETAAAVPTLTYGELGVNITDKKIFVGNSSSVATLIVDGNASGVSLSASNAFTGANTFTNATGQTFRAAATQDGIIIDGRSGGTGSFAVTVVPTTLTASRTLTLPDANTTIVGTDTDQVLTSKYITLKAGLGIVGTAPLKFTSGTNLPTAETGAVEYDGSFFYQTPNTTSGRANIPPVYTFRRTTNGSNIGSAIADFFTTPSSLSLEAASVYKISCFAYFLKNNAGTSTWTHTFSNAPTVFTAILTHSPITGIGNGSQTFQLQYAAGQATATIVHGTTGTLSNGVNHFAQFEIYVVTNLATNWRLRLTTSSGNAQPLAGSFYTIQKVSTSTGTFVA